MFHCYHTTIKERLKSISKNGLKPNSKPIWFMLPVPYIMLSLRPWRYLNGENSIVLGISDPAIRESCFVDPEGLRWPFIIKPENIEILTN